MLYLICAIIGIAAVFIAVTILVGKQYRIEKKWTTDPATEPGWYEVFWDADHLSGVEADIVMVWYRFGDPKEGLWFTDDGDLYPADDSIWLRTKEPIKLTKKPNLTDFAEVEK